MLETLIVVLKGGAVKTRRIDAIAEQVAAHNRTRFKVTGLSRKRIKAAFEAHVQGRWVVRGSSSTPDACKRGSSEGVYIVERVEDDTATLDDAVAAFEQACALMLDRAKDVVRAAIARPGSFHPPQPIATEPVSLRDTEQDAFAGYDD